MEQENVQLGSDSPPDSPQVLRADETRVYLKPTCNIYTHINAFWLHFHLYNFKKKKKKHKIKLKTPPLLHYFEIKSQNNK